MRSYARPTSLDEAIRLMTSGPRLILAGGTDLYPAAGTQLDGDVMDLSEVSELTGISAGGDLRIGACTTWTQIAEADLPSALRCLQQAARQIGGRQVQNAGTIGGNLCNASPAADGVPPLLALDARLELIGPKGSRQMPLAEFLTAPRQTQRAADEVLAAVIVPQTSLTGQSAFVKLGARAYLVISIAMVAVRVQVSDGKITETAVAVGACSGVARRLPKVEAALIGAIPANADGVINVADIAEALAPIDDVRATGIYRLTAAAELVRRAVRGAVT